MFFAFIPNYTQASLSSYFYNSDQQANQAYENGDYATAGKTFQDPYKKGVAYYRMGDYSAAEEMFRLSIRPEVASSAAYNLGNALAQQNRLQDAITAYEDVLKKWPDHKQAKENLELLKKMLQQEEQQQKDDQNNQNDSDQQKNEQNQQQQKENSSPQEDSKEQPKDQPQKDSNSDEQRAGNTQKQENTAKEESPQDNLDTKQQEQTTAPQQEKEKPIKRSQEDLDADLWLSQIKNDSKSFLKNKFYLESKKNGTKEEVDPW
jgi:Ca-activated chloride channel family protein